MDTNYVLKDNAMLRVKPELYNQWDFQKNDDLKLNIYDVTKGSHIYAWWTCLKCNSSYDMKIYKKVSNQNCPYCRGLKVNDTNSLAVLRPDIVAEWHPTKNGKLTPHDVTCGSDKKVWWKCTKEHEWQDHIIERTRESGKNCPFCANRRVWIGFNDMKTTNPTLAKLLLHPLDGDRYTQLSNKEVDWKCDCGNIITNKKISQVNVYGLGCSDCSDGLSFPERYIYNLLIENNIEFVYDSSQAWSQGKRYDFYLPDYNWIIEVHGIQHYNGSFSSYGGRTLENERDNDKLKKELAIENGIENYIDLDTRFSEGGYIERSILCSDIVKICHKLNFKEVEEQSQKPMVRIVCELWNTNEYTISDLVEKVKLDRTTIRKYLSKGDELGWCVYSSKRGKAVIQLDIDNNYIREWETSSEAEKTLGIRHVSEVCRGIGHTAGGYKWVYKENYC